jgi:hypothetical protein
VVVEVARKECVQLLQKIDRKAQQENVLEAIKQLLEGATSLK